MRGTTTIFADIDALTPERAWIKPFLRCPSGWKHDPSEDTANAAHFWSPARGLLVMVSGAVELDGKRWIHVSLSRRERVPSYDDLAVVKRAFIGEDKQAIQLFTRRAEHVNVHRFCLHLWHCVDGDGLPDFRAMGQV